MPPRAVRHAVTQPQDPSYRLIPLTQGQNAIVDTEDYERVRHRNWIAQWSWNSLTFYATWHSSKEFISMHREILGCSQQEDCDHRNGNGLDNRKRNLRKCTVAQNAWNRGVDCDSRTGYKGVSARRFDLWRARITVNRKVMHLGDFHSPIEAAKAYDAAAREYHGEFACLNFPSG